MARLMDLKGMTFGRITVIRLNGRTRWGQAVWLCRCNCGSVKSIVARNLTSGDTHSCGCLGREKSAERARRRVRPIIHGHAKKHRLSPEYKAFYGAKTRCNNPNATNFKHWGGRGIKFRFDTFLDFLAHIGPRPSLKHSLDRINNDAHYERGNVRWATRKEQRLNMRRS